MSSSRLVRALNASVAAAALLASGAALAATGYYTQGGKLFEPDGTELRVRGIGHFGFETTILQPQYLWQMGWKEQIAQIKALGFNAVRLPFAPDTLYVTTPVDQLSAVHAELNADLVDKTPLQFLDLWMAEADRQGLFVMLDFHSVTRQRLYPAWFVAHPSDYGLVHNNAAYTPADWQRDLVFVAERYAHLPHFFAIDLYNEPQGKVRWGPGDPNLDDPMFHWKAAAGQAAAAVLAANPRLLVFVQGIGGNFDGIEDSTITMNWGENFQPQAYQPLDIPADKLVLSPHTYGPDVFAKPAFGAANFPANLAADWEALFGQFHPAHPVVIGEWGGRYGAGPAGAQDQQWQDALVSWLVGKGMRSSFYWSYTPNSGDTGGILHDSLRVLRGKHLLLNRLWGSGLLQLSARGYAVAPGESLATVTVNRTRDCVGAVAVSYATADGTAVAGTDYAAASGTLSWGDGDESARSIRIPVSADAGAADRYFTIRLSQPTGGALTTAPVTARIVLPGIPGG